jgi:hypothetical protein
MAVHLQKLSQSMPVENVNLLPFGSGRSNTSSFRKIYVHDNPGTTAGQTPLSMPSQWREIRTAPDWQCNHWSSSHGNNNHGKNIRGSTSHGVSTFRTQKKYFFFDFDNENVDKELGELDKFDERAEELEDKGGGEMKLKRQRK